MTGKPKELSAERLAEDENVMIAISRLEYLADVNARANSTKASDECRGFADLLTRLSRENAALKVERDRWKFCVERFEDRALTAEAKLADALAGLTSVCVCRDPQNEAKSIARNSLDLIAAITKGSQSEIDGKKEYYDDAARSKI